MNRTQFHCICKIARFELNYSFGLEYRVSSFEKLLSSPLRHIMQKYYFRHVETQARCSRSIDEICFCIIQYLFDRNEIRSSSRRTHRRKLGRQTLLLEPKQACIVRKCAGTQIKMQSLPKGHSSGWRVLCYYCEGLRSA